MDGVDGQGRSLMQMENFYWFEEGVAGGDTECYEEGRYVLLSWPSDKWSFWEETVVGAFISQILLARYDR